MPSTKDISADLTLRLKSGTMRGKAVGKMHLFTGEVQVTHDYDSPLVGFNPLFLSVAALTGTPAPEKVLDGTKNHFKDAHSFEFDREVQFSTGQALRVIGKYDSPDEKTLAGTLELQGVIPEETTISILNTIESWTRQSSSQIDGAFDMVWETQAGSIITAHTKTAYILNGVHLDKYPLRQFRSITIQNYASKNMYKQDEQISMFCSVPGHCSSFNFLSPLVP